MVFETLFPARCAGCGRLGDAPCAACRAAFRPVRAGRVAPPAGLDEVVVCFEYAGALRAVLTALKYRDNRATLRWLGEQLAIAWLAQGLDGALTWAPTSAPRARRRGFDQSELLARSLARRLGPQGPGRVTPTLRRHAGPAQTGRLGRRRDGAVTFSVPARDGAIPESMVVVDDVLTTGATLAGAAAALRAAGCRRVVGLVVAWTPPFAPLGRRGAPDHAAGRLLGAEPPRSP